MSHVVISGYYGSKNAGDEAMLAAMVEVLSDLNPKVHITVISADPEDTKKRHGVEAIGWLDFCGIIGALRQADVLLSGGGSLLQNITSRRSLYYYLVIIWLAQLCSTPVMLYAQGIGPISGRIARWVMRHIGNRVKMITVRDRGSLQELAELGINKPHIEATADPVHAIHRVDKNIGRSILQRYGVAGAKPVVGISVREWCNLEPYKKAVAMAADQIAQEFGARIAFLPMQYPEDVKTAETVAAMTQGDVVVLKEEYTTSELLSIVGNMDLLLAIRLHALIFAGVMGVPMIGISYDPKVDRFLESVGEKAAGNLQDITSEKILEKVRQKWQSRAEFSGANEQLFADLRELAMHNAELAYQIMENK
ncbi:MAG: polysaccharide pyruvyl transferase CsaB [Anaerovibrio sp.]|nr:polysaccharide pyruvyl transferase CsaB [Selenomonadaceae bacterium]MDD6397702.1 polysaccharide pyruvyl transferase CsaB [Selenomonadaceae bacterium]MDY6052624.1 polysaccharide pyruvyl transferase CsaB [Anaerovibrio sp.]